MRGALLAGFSLVAGVLVLVAPSDGTVAAARTPGELLRYDFTEGSGSVVSDTGSGAALDLTIDDPGNVTWSPGGGLTIDSPTRIASLTSTKIATAVAVSNEFTVEAWVSSQDVGLNSRGQIVSSGRKMNDLNFNLFEYGNRDSLATRVRSKDGHYKGTPELETAVSTAPIGTLSQIIMTRATDGTRTIYVDGVATASNIASGTMDNWTTSFPFVIGNDGIGGDPFLGTFCRVAFYDSALNQNEIDANFAAGCSSNNPGNTDPEIDPLPARTDIEGDAVTLNVNASDVDGDSLTFSATGLPEDLDINSSTGTISGVLSQSAAAGSPFTTTVTVADGQGGDAAATFQWTIDAVNFDPAIDFVGPQTAVEGQNVSLTINASDVDGDVLSFSAQNLPPGLAINATTGVISGQVAAGAKSNSPYDVAVLVVDNAGGSDSINFPFTIDVATLPQPVVQYDFTEGSGDTVADSGSGVGLDLQIADESKVTWIPGGGLTIDAATKLQSLTAATKVVQAAQSSGEITVEAWIATEGTDSRADIVSNGTAINNVNFLLSERVYLDRFTYRVRSAGSYGGQPELRSNSGAAVPGELKHLVITRDAAGDRVMYIDGVQVSSNNKVGALSNWNSSYPLLLANTGDASKPFLGSFCRVAIYDVAFAPGEVGAQYGQGCQLGAPNNQPTVDAVADQTNAEGDTVSVTVSGFDPDGDALTYGASALPTGLSINAASGVISGVLSGTAATGSPFDVTVTVDDGRGGLASTAFQWTVTATNVAPQVIDPGPQNSAEGEAVSLQIVATDSDGDTVQFSATGLPTGLDIDVDGLISGTVAGGASVDSPFTAVVTADDGAGGITTTSITWTVAIVTGPEPVIEYRFDEGSGGVVSDSGAGSPLNLAISDQSKVTWLPGGGLAIEENAGITSAGAATKIFTAATATDELTMEAWIIPAGKEVGRGQIVNSGFNLSNANFQLFERGYNNRYASRVRADSSEAGTPELVSPNSAVVPDQLSHVVVTRNAAGDRVMYIDGQQVSSNVRTTTFGNWNANHPLSIGNFAGGSEDFEGVLCNVRLYDVALDASEVSDRFSAGCDLGVTPTEPASALVTVTAGQGVAASTFSGSPFAITNTGAPGAPAITKVEFDITGSMIPDATFDPVGDAGDALAKCVVVGSEGGTGYIAPTDPCVDPFSIPHEDEPGTAGNGFDGLSLDFADFQAGETLTFAVDIDPTTIQNVPGSGGTGAVSGLELTGSTVTITFDDGQIITRRLFGDGSQGGAAAVVSSVVGLSGPTAIELVGVVAQPTVFPNDSVVAVVAAVGPQTVRVSGPVGAEVVAQVSETVLENPTGFDIDPYEADSVSAVQYLTGTIGVGGTVDFTLDVDDPSVLYDVVATVDDGANGGLSQKLIVTVETPAAALVQITPGGDVEATTYGNATITVTNTGDTNAPAISGVTFDLRGSLIPDATFDPVGAAGDAGTQCLEVSAEGGTGYVVPGDNCTDPFSLDHEDSPGVVGNGHDGMSLAFSDFGGGESVVFGVDVDPTTIQGVPGSGGAGAVSGLELTGSTVTVVFADGQVVTSPIFGDGSGGGGQAVVTSAAGAPATIELVGAVAVPTVFPNDSVVAEVPNTGVQTVRITGAAGATVTLLDVDGDLLSPTPFDQDPFESDAAVSVAYTPGVIGLDGTLDVVVDIDDATVLHHFVALVNDGVGDALTQKLIVAVATPAGALVEITPNSTNIDASTFTAGSLSITNTGEVGDAAIASVSIDLRGSIVPDATFDPNGTAGDTAAKCLVVSAGAAATGYVTPTDECVDPFSVPHEDEPGVAGEGFDVITLDFTDFGPGETLTFAIDIDATTIQGVDGSGGAGSVSGLELTGSLVSVTFDDGATQTVSMNQLFGDGSVGGSQAFVSDTVGQIAPVAVEVLGVATVATEFPNGSQVGSVPATGPQTVRVTAAEGDAVTLLQMTGDVVTDPAFDLDDFESDTAIAVDYFGGIVDATGIIDFPVDVASADVLYHYVAVVDDGATGTNSTQLVIGVGLDVNAPVFTPIDDVIVDAGATINVPISSTSPIGEAITLSIASTPEDIVVSGAALTDNGDGTGSIDWITDIADVGVYQVDVTATTASGSATTSFQIVIDDPNGGAPLFRINAGGPEVAAADGGIPWSEDQAETGGTAGGTAAFGTASPHLTSTNNITYGTGDPITLTDASVPAGTPEALFQTERYTNSTAPVTYSFDVVSGQEYEVDLYFAEIFQTADGARLFDVTIEGDTVLDNYDIHAAVGHDTGQVVTFTVPVAAEPLEISFGDATADNPKISAIEVRTAGPPPSEVPPVIDPIADQVATIGGSLSVPITTTEYDGDQVTLTYTSNPDASAFANFVDDGNGMGSFAFQPVAGQAGTYTVVVTATDVDGSDTEVFNLEVLEPGGQYFARINAGGPAVPSLDAGPDWEQDNNASPSQYLADAGSAGNSGGAALEPNASVPAYVPGAVLDTERWSNSGFAYDIPVPAGTQVFVRLYLGNVYGGTSGVGQRVFDISIDGVLVENDIDLIVEYGNELAGMREYLITSDGVIDIDFSNVVENPLVNAIEVVSATSSPDTLGVSPTALDFGLTLTGGSASETVTLSNLGFDAGDPTIEVTAVTAAGGEFTSNFVGPMTLVAGGTDSFDVTFAPTADGPQTGTLTITHTGTNSPMVVTLDGDASNNIPVSFSQTGLSGETSNNPTSLQFGPDGRLYVAQQDASIKVYSIQRNSATDYDVFATEQIDLVKTNTPNHDDDGAENATQQRQVTGLLVTGTAANPVVYVTSSDSRISVGNDSGLDTNSGVVSRLTFNGATWDKVDVVRGLPRSEENHSTNGLALDDVTNTLYVMQGGHANTGAPGNNFSGTPEYYLSAALLTVDLDAIDALGTFVDPRNGAEVAYDLRTLDDPTRSNITNADAGFPYAVGHPLYNASIDVGDPFGGNNSLNQAIPEPGGPVQIYSPGYRNAFDVVLTSQGRLYTSDNGPNGGWGGVPLSYTSGGAPISTGSGPYELSPGDYCTNEFNQDGGAGHGDTLHFIDGPGYYGGHPTPIRAFPGLARVVDYIEQGNGNWVLSGGVDYDFFDLVPSDIPAGFFANNPVECDYTSNDPGKYLDIVNASTNGITEYTATNFGGKLQGNILTASFNGNIYSYGLNAAGDTADTKTSLFSGFGSQPLDVIAQGDSDPFPGTVWAVAYGADTIVVFEPSDSSTCTGADDINLDEDNDGYTNADEIDAGTDPCSGGDKPTDNDGDNLSDFNDPDDDNDGIADVDDEFAVDPDNGLTTSIPVLRPFENNDPGTFLFGLGLTGLMTNGVDTYLEQFDPGSLAAGGNGGELGVEQVTAGDAYQAVNSQDNAFQYGVDADTTTDPFVVTTEVSAPIFAGTPPVNFMSTGLQVGAGDQDNYLKVVVNANAGNGGIQVLKEVGGIVALATQYGAADLGGASVLAAGAGVTLSVVVDPAALTAQARAQVDGGPIFDLGAPIDIPAAWLDPNDANGFAVGVISTSTNSGTPFDTLYAYLDVEFVAGVNDAPVIDPIAPQTVAEGDTLNVPVSANDNDADPLTYALIGAPAGMAIDASGVITWATDLDDSDELTVTVEVSDGVNPAVTEDVDVSVTQTDSGIVLRRINVGGPLVATTDAGPDWAANPNPNTLTELVAGGDNVYPGGTANSPVTDISDATVPAGTPIDVFNHERWDASAAPAMAWKFAATPGAEIEVRIGHAELFKNTTQCTPGARVYDIVIDGNVVDTVDVCSRVNVGSGFVTDYLVTADADGIDIVFNHVALGDNPAVKSFEIIELTQAPNTAPTIDSFVPASPVTIGEGVAMAPITVNASDVDGDPITLTTDGLEPAGVLFTDNGDGTGTFSGTPTATGSFPVVVTADDGTGSSTDTIVIDVEANDAPTITPIADQVIAENDVLSVQIDANDNDGDPLSYALVGAPAGTSIDGTGLITWTTDLASSGRYPITVEVTDNVNAPVAASFTLDVTQTDVGTVLRRINAGGPLVANTDGGPDWAANPNPNTLDELVAGGELTYGGNSPINDISHPTVPAGAVVTLFNTERYDADTGDEMAWNFPAIPGAVVEIRIGLGEIYGPAQAPGTRVFDIEIDGVVVETGLDPFAIGVNAGVGIVTDYVVTADGDGIDVTFIHGIENPAVKWFEIIEVTPAPNSDPTIDSVTPSNTIAVEQGATLPTVTVISSDVDGDDPALTTDGNEPAGITFNDAGDGTGTFTGSTAVAPGSYPVVVTATDDEGATDTTTVTFNVTTPANQPPAITPVADQTVAEGDTLDFDVDASDPDVGDTLTYSLSGEPTGMTIDAAGGVVFSPTFDDAGTTNVTVSVSDGVNPAVTDDFDVTVTNTNRAPVIDTLPASAPATEGVAMSDVEVAASDPDTGDTIILTTTALPAGIDFADDGDGTGSFSGTPSAAPATYTVTVTASDGTLEATQDIDIVVAANAAPAFDAALADVTIAELATLSVSASATDPEGQPLAYAFVGAVPAGMTIDAGTGAIAWTPDLAGSGVYGIAVSVDDGFNPVVVDSFTVSVTQTAPPGEAIFRVNVGGPGVASADSSFLDWSSDTGAVGSASASPYYVGGANGVYPTSAGPNLDHPTVPATAPASVYQTERYGDMQYTFPVPSGTDVEVRILLNETFGTAAPVRSFDISIDGAIVAAAVDPITIGGAQHAASVLDFLVTSDGIIDIDFTTHIDNGSLKGIEILGVSGNPAVDFVDSLDGETITSDSATIQWMFNGFNTTNDHVHFTIDGVADLNPPNDETANLPQTHNTLYRTSVGTSIDLVNLSDGEHTVTVTVADTSHAEYGNPEAFATATFTVDTAVAPVAPAGLAATDGDAVVALDWDDDPNAVTFYVYRSTTLPVPTASGTEIGTSATSDYSDATVSNGTIYYYAVVAENTIGAGPASSQVSGFPLPDTAVIERINAGGALVASTDSHQDWEADTSGSNHPTLTVNGNNKTSATPGVTGRHVSVASYVPSGIYTTNERWAQNTTTGMTYDIPVTAGQTVDVRLFLSNHYSGSSAPGAREFDVTIDGALVLDAFGPVVSYGDQIGGMERFVVTDDGDGLITISFTHVSNGAGGTKDNPNVNGIEVRETV